MIKSVPRLSLSRVWTILVLERAPMSHYCPILCEGWVHEHQGNLLCYNFATFEEKFEPLLTLLLTGALSLRCFAKWKGYVIFSLKT